MKKKKIVLDCFTDRPDVIKYSSVDYAHKFFPDWWKNLNKTFIAKENNIDVELATIKTCVGFIEQYQHGIIIPMWSDFHIKLGSTIKPEYFWKFSDNISSCGNHSSEQRGSEYLPDNKYCHVKLNSPWFFKCNEDIKFALTPTFWNFYKPEDILIPPGILDFKYQMATNINIFFWYKEKEETYYIKHGKPLVQFIPLSERKLKIKTHLVSKEEMDKLFPRVPISRLQRYRKQKKIMQKNEKSCPFGF